MGLSIIAFSEISHIMSRSIHICIIPTLSISMNNLSSFSDVTLMHFTRKLLNFKATI